jgi:hypothetical protein
VVTTLLQQFQTLQYDIFLVIVVFVIAAVVADVVAATSADL